MPDFLIDIGKVLLDFDFESSLQKFLPSNHPDPSAALEKLLSRKDDFEAGLISVDDYTQWAIETLDSNATTAEFHHSWNHIFTPNLPMWETARALHTAGHRIILFSNTNAIHCPWIFDAYPEFSIFDGSVLSYEIQSIKPQPKIYQHAIDKFALIPENTLYIDDLPANIQTGKDFGFHTHLYDLNKHHELELWLAQHLSFPNTDLSSEASAKGEH